MSMSIKGSRPTLHSLNLVVRDMEAALAFYRRLGLEIPDESVWRTETGGHHVGIEMSGGTNLDLDSPALAQEYNAGWKPASGPPRCVFSFSVETREAVNDLFAEMTGAGYAGMQSPFDAFWGCRYAIVEDPDGNHVGIMSPRDAATGSAPPSI
jgi:catechol 2,3-dioxygenase-like lactoylglutathione lyase family enzyme